MPWTALALALQLLATAAPAPARPPPATTSAGAPATAAGKDPGGTAPGKGAGALDLSRYPADQRARYQLVVQKCSRCHGLEKSLNPRLTPDEWRRYLKRMIRLSGSGVSEAQAADIEAFLVYFSSHPRR